jgi:signal transduction histidine kinase
MEAQMESATLPATRKVVIGSLVAVVTVSMVTLARFPSALRAMFSTDFLPHVYCYRFDKQLVSLHLGSDVAIWLSYLAISCTLVYLVWRTRREIPFSWMFLAFGLFIVACGFTHLMEVVVLWKPLYWLAGDVKLLTAVASVVTAVALPGLIPQVHGMVSAAHVSEERRQQLERANAELQQLSSRVMNTQDEERRRLSRELHDSVGQYLVGIKMSCGLALRKSRDAEESGALKDALDLLDRCTEEVRTMSHLLHPPVLEEIGLGGAIPWYVKGFTKRSGIEVQLEMPSDGKRYAAPVELALYRVLQESLTNIHRHAGAKQARIRLHIESGKALLTIEDRGKGFGSGNNQAFRAGLGIASMRERVRELGGELRVNSGVQGTTVEAVVPLQEQE